MKRSIITLSVIILSIGISYTQNKKIKILISVDMEGLAGVVTAEQLGPSGFEYERFRRFMTDEAIAAVNGAFEAGATEIVVADAHGNGQNLLIEKFPDNVRIIRSWPRRFGMVAGIDASFDGVILIGYHASTHNMKGVRAHTFSSARLTDVRINAQSVSEGMWAAMVTGHFGVPVIMISGDDIATKEVKDFLGDVEVAVVKEAYGFHSAITLTPKVATRLIKEASRKAVSRIKKFDPYIIAGPVKLEVSFKNYQPSAVLEYLSVVERIDSHSIRFTGKDMVEVADFFVFLMEYNSNIKP